AGEIGADGDDPGNASARGPGDDLRQISLELGTTQMGVGVVKERHEAKVRRLEGAAIEIRRPKPELRKKAEVRRPKSEVTAPRANCITCREEAQETQGV